LKHFTKTVSRVSTVSGVAMVIVAALSFSSASALADAAERPWKDPTAAKPARPTSFLNSFLPGKSTKNKPSAPIVGGANITQPKQPGKARKAVVRKKQPKPVRAARRTVKKPTRKTAVNAPVKQADWWENVGNPAVFAFRDCSVGYARLQAVNGSTLSAADVITAAMRSSCQTEFAKMAGVLIGGLGEKQSNAILIELAKTTFLPTVQAALQTERNRSAATKGAKFSYDEKLQASKAAMFQCFSERTDRLAIARKTQPVTIADAVLASCQKQSDLFFDYLFANSKASQEVKLQQKTIALGETYKIAIIRRVLASRKTPQVKTATQQ